jgi:uncharacterized protein (DUF433 family)
MGAKTEWLPTPYRFGKKLAKQLAHELGVSPKQVEDILSALKAAGWLRWHEGGIVEVKAEAPRHLSDDFARRVVCRLLGWELTDHPRIVRTPQILGGTPVIAGTRMPVYAIASAFRAGKGLYDILSDYPFLTLAEVEAALLYYLSHKAEIDEKLERSELEWLTQKYAPFTEAKP